MKFSKEKYIGLGHVPTGIGAIIKGWNVEKDDFRNPNTLPVVDFRAMTPACPPEGAALFFFEKEFATKSENFHNHISNQKLERVSDFIFYLDKITEKSIL